MLVEPSETGFERSPDANPVKTTGVGLWLARSFSLQKANLIGHLLMETRNLRESVEFMDRYLRISSNNITFRFDEEGKDAIFSFTVRPKLILHYNITEFYMSEVSPFLAAENISCS